MTLNGAHVHHSLNTFEPNFISLFSNEGSWQTAKHNFALFAWQFNFKNTHIIFGMDSDNSLAQRLFLAISSGSLTKQQPFQTQLPPLINVWNFIE